MPESRSGPTRPAFRSQESTPFKRAAHCLRAQLCNPAYLREPAGAMSIRNCSGQNELTSPLICTMSDISWHWLGTERACMHAWGAWKPDSLCCVPPDHGYGETGLSVLRLLLAGWCRDSESASPLQCDGHRSWFGVSTVACMCLCILVQQVLPARRGRVPVRQGLLETCIASISQPWRQKPGQERGQICLESSPLQSVKHPALRPRHQRR